MKIVVQKVKRCTLYSNGEKFSSINQGMLVLLGVSNTDTFQTAQKTAQKIMPASNIQNILFIKTPPITIILTDIG